MSQIWLPHRRKSFQAGGAFSPNDITGLVWWIETDFEVTSDGDGVGDWTDRSASGLDLTQATGANKPDIVANNFASGIDGIQGDGSNDHMDMDSDLVVTGDFSFFAVIEYVTNNQGFMGRGAGTVDNQYRIDNRIRIEIADSGATSVTTFASMSNNTEYLIEVHRDSSDDITAFINGVDDTFGTPNIAGTHTLNVLFAPHTQHSYTDAIIGGIFIYDNKVSSGDAASLRTYANDKYTIW